MNQPTCKLQFKTQAEVLRTSLSAVRFVGQHLWLGCDEGASLERLTFKEDTASDHQHFPISDFLELPGPDGEEIDVEGIAYADHYLWFVGSHSLKRKSYQEPREVEDNLKRHRTVECEENRFTLGRIPLVEGQLHRACAHPDNPAVTLTAAQLKRKKTGNELTARLRDDRYLGAFLKAQIPGKDNGFDVEGIAVMGDRLLLGLRGPVLRGWATLLEVQLTEEKPGTLKLQKLGDDKQRYILHFLNLKGLGIRDLCPWHDQLLILAGPTMTLDGSVGIFSVPLADLQAQKPFLQPAHFMTVPAGTGGDRAEGLSLLDANSAELLVVYDAPTAARLKGKTMVLADRFSLPSAAAEAGQSVPDKLEKTS